MEDIKPAPLQPKKTKCFKKFVRWFILYCF